MKGLRTILQEGGINTSTMRADDMRVVLSNHDDFVNEKTIVEHFLHERGHLAYFLPKFHRKGLGTGKSMLPGVHLILHW